jgi:hypothetical protein
MTATFRVGRIFNPSGRFEKPSYSRESLYRFAT